MTQTELADAVGAVPSTISRIATGKLNCSLRLALAIERALEFRVAATELPLSPKNRDALATLRGETP